MSSYPGLNILLMGPSGTGKTYSIGTAVETGLEVFYLGLEPGLETLIGYFSDHGKPLPPNLHWHYLQPKSLGFDDLIKSAEKVEKFDLKFLASSKDLQRSVNSQLVPFFSVLNNFTCQRDGKSYGNVSQWGTDRLLVIDSFSAITSIMWDAVVGGKVVKDVSEWGLVQTLEMNFLTRMTYGCNCHFILIAHVEREVDQITGLTKIMVAAPGKAINGQIPKFFSDVILSVREGDKFYWDTASSQADVKTRNLPIQSKLPASFEPIWKKWSERRALAEGNPS